MNKEQTNEKLSQDGGEDKCSHCRDMIQVFLNSTPHIKSMYFVNRELDNGETERTGDIAFTVFLDSMGFSKQTYVDYEKEFLSAFMINFFGEFLVRENISQFVDIALEVESRDFINAISVKNHRTFGLKVQGNVITFTFHVSLLSNILTEELKNLDWQ